MNSLSIQWNLSNPDTPWNRLGVHFMEVNMQMQHLGPQLASWIQVS